VDERSQRRDTQAFIKQILLLAQGTGLSCAETCGACGTLCPPTTQARLLRPNHIPPEHPLDSSPQA
jgi:hypothetical protein